MNIKKKIVGFMLAVCLILPSMFAMVGCGNVEPEYLQAGLEYYTDGNEITINWDLQELIAMGVELDEEITSLDDLDAIAEVECVYINDEFLGAGYAYISADEDGKIATFAYRHEILADGTIKLYETKADFESKTARTDVTCTINAERTQITFTMPIFEGYTSTITAVYTLVVEE